MTEQNSQDMIPEATELMDHDQERVEENQRELQQLSQQIANIDIQIKRLREQREELLESKEVALDKKEDIFSDLAARYDLENGDYNYDDGKLVQVETQEVEMTTGQEE